jgi:hypothetical protein
MNGMSAMKVKSPGKHSKRKGKVGESEVSHRFIEAGFNSRRTVQFCGRAGDSDIVVDELSDFFFEVKRQNTIRLHEWWEQVTSDCKERTPVLIFRRDRDDWKVCMSLTDWINLVKERSCKDTILSISRASGSSVKE